MRAFAVIGANFGDEGKGLMTDYLVRQLQAEGKKPLVVRYNGGAQAGHTVVDAETGKRHVFSHFGAGSFAGAPTYLSSAFIVNPFAFYRELNELKKIGVPPVVIMSPQCQITTVFDMAINGMRELLRSHDPSKRHGSCGMGINETIQRVQQGFSLTIADLGELGYQESANRFANKLYHIFYDYWKPLLSLLEAEERARNNGDMRHAFQELLYTCDLTKETDMMMSFWHRRGFAVGAPKVFKEYDSVVFEGAQGLMLDEFLGQFPHVTRSVTGLPGVLAVAKEVGVTRVKPVYVTRAFLTRHGAGPLADEGVEFFSEPELLTDKTNKFGKWQGKFRYARLNLLTLRSFIRNDIERSELLTSLTQVMLDKPVIALTHADVAAQGDLTIVDGYSGVNTRSRGSDVSVEDFINNALEPLHFGQAFKTPEHPHGWGSFDLNVEYVSYGETASDVKLVYSPFIKV